MEEKKRGRNDGFTDAQRKWIKNRDAGECQLCGSTDQLEVHHITPWRWAATVLHWDMVRVNLPTNGITLCQQCHSRGNNAIHPDWARATHKYQDDKKIYDQVFAVRDDLCRKQQPYWMTAHDNRLTTIAVKRTMQFIADGNFPSPWMENCQIKKVDTTTVITLEKVTEEKNPEPKYKLKPEAQPGFVSNHINQFIARNK